MFLVFAFNCINFLLGCSNVSWEWHSILQTSHLCLVSGRMAAGGSPPQSQLTVEDVFWNATILHTADMSQPSQSALSKQSVHTGSTSPRIDVNVGYFVLPEYSQDTADVSQVECVEPSILPAYSTCLAGIHQCAENTGIVDCHLCLHR